MDQPFRWRDQWLVAIAVAGALAYVIFGASSGDLFLPLGRGGTEFHLSGLAAWLFVPVVLLIWLGVLARAGLFHRLRATPRILVEICLWSSATGLAIVATQM